MGSPGALDWSGPFIRATVNYIDPDAADPGGIDDADRERSTLKLIPHPVRVHDARPMQPGLSLEGNGFVWLRRPTAVTDFADQDEVTRVYYREAEQVVADLTGAETVLVFGQVQRDGARRESRHQPVYNAHVDYDVPTIRAVARRLLPPEEFERRKDQRILLVNLWRPLAPVESAPLAVCDASSVARRDLVYGPIGGDSAAGVPGAAGYNVAHSPMHRWCYVPAMQPDELLVLKLCDTDADRVQWTAHTSVDPPDAPPDARPRRSIELRTLAFIPDGRSP